MPQYPKVGKYIMRRKIGEGAFAEVRLAVHEDTKEEFAVKIFDRASLPRAHFERDIKKEIKIMQHLRHPNIVSIHAVLVTEHKLYLVMELVRGGELYDEIVKNQRIDEQTSRKYFQQIVDAMVYCHRRGVVHRDLKPENLLLDGNGNIKITDFGMSWMKENIDPAVKAKQLLQTQCGTPKYMPPEIIMRSRYGYDGEKLDAWECGMVLYALLAGYLPFNGNDDRSVFRSILNGKVRFPSHFSPGAKDLLSRLLEKDPNHRSTLADIRGHFWFLVNYHGDAVEERERFLRQARPGPLQLQSEHDEQEDESNKENIDPYRRHGESASSTPKKKPSQNKKAVQRKISVDGRPKTPATPKTPKQSPSSRNVSQGSGQQSLSRKQSSNVAGPKRTPALPEVQVKPDATRRDEGRILSEKNGFTSEGRKVEDTSIADPRRRRTYDSSAAPPTPKSETTGRQQAAGSRIVPPLFKISSFMGQSLDEDDAPISFKDRIRTPIANILRTLRSGAGSSYAREVADTEDKKDTTWFSQTSPTAVQDIASNSDLSSTQRKPSALSHSSSSDEFQPADDFSAMDDIASPSSRFRRVTKVLQKKV